MSVPVVIVLTIALMAILSPIYDIGQDVRTRAVTDTGLTCTTDVGETSCAVTLTEDHQYHDTSRMTVTETSPGATDRTSTSVLTAADRTTLTVSGLSASTAYIFTVVYRGIAADLSEDTADAINLSVPVFIVFYFVMLAVAGILFARRSELPGWTIGMLAIGGLIFSLVMAGPVGSIIAGFASGASTSGMAAIINLSNWFLLLVALIVFGYMLVRRSRA